MSHLTIAYFTSRKEPRLDWFFNSLHRETGGEYLGIDIVVVDHWFRQREYNVYDLWPYNDGWGSLRWVAPKPTVWQGERRLTQTDWFAASNARNTAICLAPDGWIAFVDDVSVLTPGWLSRVREAMQHPRRITCGAYRKVLNLQVSHDANTITFDDFPAGHDNRMAHVQGDGPHPCAGNWMYGCSLVAPVEAFLQINGYPEAWCDGMGFEDCIAGIMLEKKGYSFVYDPRMLTLESEELHHQKPVMVRSDYGVSPNDKSHAVLNAAQQGDGWHPNYFGEEGLRGLRQRILAGEPFPIVQVPEHEFFTATPLSQLQPK
jgi:glycosyltransferase involved in cell wall biosynthesis